MSHRAHRMRWQQTMVWAWLLLLAFVPQLVMKATHFHHAHTHSLVIVDAKQHTHNQPSTNKADCHTATATIGTQWLAQTPTDTTQECAEYCDLCHYTPLWSVIVPTFFTAYDASVAARAQTLPHTLALTQGVLRTNALRGPPTT
ncbi:MAG: hypothetical protein Q4A44_03670 [Bacteroidales bacterium]|nr:hypothetical protein [Bacteroidales bacterium]